MHVAVDLGPDDSPELVIRTATWRDLRAIARLEKGKRIEPHIDPMEEIYFILSGEGEMEVGEETRPVGPGDAIWIPVGSVHALTSSHEEDCIILVVASPLH